MPYVGNKSTTFNTFSATDVSVTDDLTVTDDASVGGDLTVTGTTQSAHIGIDVAPHADYGLTIKNEDDKHIRLRNADEYAFIQLDDAGDLKLWAHGDENITFLNKTGSGTTAMNIDSNGAVTKPLQPAFLAQPASTQSNIPINTTTTIVLGTEVYDVNADFASNTFTAPVTGKYQLCLQVSMQNLDTATDYYQLDIVTSNRTYQFLYDPTHHSADVTYAVFTVSALADMDASDTAFARLYIPNSGAAQADVTTSTYFSGFLAC